MKADEVLIEHHVLLRALLKELDQTRADEPERRRCLLDVLMSELAIHTGIEEEIFYPAVRKATPLVDVAFAEHRHLDEQLAAVLRTDPKTERFAVEFDALKSGVEQHAGEEERDMFPQARAMDTAERERLGERLKARQEYLRGSKFAQFRIALKRELLRRAWS